MIRKSFAILFIVFTSIACKKNATIVGRVYNPATGEGMADQEVQFFKNFDSKDVDADETYYTDANGNYSIPFRNKGKHSRIYFPDFDTSEYYLLNNYEKNILESGEDIQYDLPVLNHAVLLIRLPEHLDSLFGLSAYFETIVSIQHDLAKDYYKRPIIKSEERDIIINAVEGNTSVDVVVTSSKKGFALSGSINVKHGEINILEL